MGKFDNIIGYGFNQKGACNRSGSLTSYDYSFSTIEKAEEEYNKICQLGYGNTLYGICAVSTLDDIKADLDRVSEDNPMSKEKLKKILKEYDIEVDEISESNIIEGVEFYFKFDDYEDIVDYNIVVSREDE